MSYEVTLGDRILSVDVEHSGDGQFALLVREGDTERRLDVHASRPQEGVLSLLLGHESWDVDVLPLERGYSISHYGTTHAVGVVDERRKALDALAGGPGGRSRGEVISTSMPGRIVTVLVEEGQAVREGDGIVVVEAMKMENELVAGADGVVVSVLVQPGDTVEGGAKLVLIEPPEES